MIAAIFQLVVDTEKIEIKFRDFSRANIEKFLNDSIGLANSFPVSDNGDVQMVHTDFYRWLESILEKYFPK